MKQFLAIYTGGPELWGRDSHHRGRRRDARLRPKPKFKNAKGHNKKP